MGMVGALAVLVVPRLAGGSVLAFLGGAEGRALAYVATGEGTVLFDGPQGKVVQATGGGIPLAVVAEDEAGYTVLTPCNTEVWVEKSTTTRGTAAPGNDAVSSAVIVIDPGHGGPDTGAVGAGGLVEKDLNLDVASRLRDLLGGSRTVDGETGAVAPGDEISAVAAVVMTRNPDGAGGGDHRVGNRFRAELGNRVEADALVSIHHNAGADLALDSPGSEVYYSHDDPDSRRLAGLVAEELLTGLARYRITWTGGERVGAVARVGPDGDDYYSLLAWSDGPAVITEGLYLSNPAEEELAATPEFRQSYAEAVYRGLIRFLATEEVGGPVHDPVPYDGGPAATMGDCSLPGPG
jgi:N-acetylmuramoyl-L-alanine amidase